MKRRALIVCCDNTPSGELLGAVQDARNVNSYLKSLAGGEWRTDEIGFLRNPSQLQVKKAVATFMKNVDYTFTVFSGHGFVHKEDGLKQYIELSDKSVPLRSLVTNSLRQTIIVDACRGFESMHRENLLEEYSSFLGDVEHLEQPSTREIFERYVKGADKGLSVLYSASLNQSALDTPSGGAFTFSLLSYAQKWSTNRNHYEALPANTAILRAKKLMYEKFDTDQKPVMNIASRNKHFPIAVKLPQVPRWLELM